MNHRTDTPRAVRKHRCLGASGALPLAALLLVASAGGLPPKEGVAQEQPAQTEVPTDASPAQLESMEARLRAALQLSPQVAAFHTSLANVLLAQGRLVEARSALAEAVRLEPSTVEHRAALGEAHLRLEEWVEAEVNFDWATRLSPREPVLYAGLGDALLAQGRISEAETAFARAAALNPQDTEVATKLDSIRTVAGALDADERRVELTITEWFTRLLRYLSAVILVVAGVGLVLPIVGAIALLLIVAPLSLIRRRTSS